MTPAPLLVVGIDAGIGALLLEEAAAGRMPNVASLIARGVQAPVVGPDCAGEFGYWTSAFTGSRSGTHGSVDFRSLVAGTYRFDTERSHDDPGYLWERLAAAGRRVAVVDAPRHSVNGKIEVTQVCSWGVHDGGPPPPATHPPELLGKLEADVRRPDIRRDHYEPRGKRATQAHADALVASVAARGQMLGRVLVEAEPDVLIAVFSEAHTAGHGLWASHRGLPGSEASLGEGLRAVYRAIDRELGRLVEAFPGANVVLVLGIEIIDAAPVEALVDQFCTRLGYRVRVTGGRRPLDLARALVPEPVRARLARALPGRIQERLMIDGLDGTDWSATRMYMIPAVQLAQLRVNLRGRDPEGIVEPGAEYEEVLRRATADLLALRDASTGEPVIGNVARIVDDDGRPPGRAPDLVGSWRPHQAVIERVSHPRVDLVQSRPGWMTVSGHGHRGYFIAAGPQIGAHGTARMLDPLDIAPTLLALGGATPTPGRPGRARTDLLGR